LSYLFVVYNGATTTGSSTAPQSLVVKLNMLLQR
jgi:hypothetical protein